MGADSPAQNTSNSGLERLPKLKRWVPVVHACLFKISGPTTYLGTEAVVVGMQAHLNGKCTCSAKNKDLSILSVLPF